jgi:hypothetical protein
MSKKHSDKQIGGQHYKHMKIQPTEFIAVNDIPFIEGNVIKYVCRHAHKNGKEDVLKAIHYLNLLIEYQYESNDLQESLQAEQERCAHDANISSPQADSGGEFCNND